MTKGQRKLERITISLEAKVLAGVVKLAGTKGQSVSEWIRNLVGEEVVRVRTQGAGNG